MYDVILTMAGKGLRMGLEKNKVLFEYNGKPMYKYSLDLFEKDPKCERIVMVVNPVDYDIIKDQVSGINKIILTLGGPTRTLSVINGISLCKSEYILIHDGARPFLKEKDLNNLLSTFNEFDIAVLGVPVKDTIKEVNDGIISKTLTRDKLYSIQTPQGGKKEIIKQAYINAMKDKISFTDDVGVVEYYFPKIKIKLVIGDYSNKKITILDDLYLFEVYENEN